MKKFLLNSSYVIFSNFLSLLVSSMVILVLPKIVGVSEYGYWQLYLFYTSYVGFAHLGWIDGIYLKNGGKEFENLDKVKFFSEFILYSIFQAIIAIVIFLISYFLGNDKDKSFIFYMLSLTLFSTNLRFFLIYLLQTTNLIRESARILIVDRLLYSLFLILLVTCGFYSFKFMIIIDVLGRFISLFYAIYLCRGIIFTRFSLFNVNLNEIIDNIKVGSKLMLSNVASMLIIGIVRLGIQRKWDVATFGKVSLALSVSNLLMIFINAIGVVIFPMLKRTSYVELPKLYLKIRNILMPVLLAFLLFFYPIKYILLLWLPSYTDSMLYMSFIFPVSIFEGKMALLINTYLKAYRKEKNLLTINIVSMLMSIIFTFISTLIFANLTFAALSITLLLFFRSFTAEIVISKIIGLNFISDILIECFLVSIFIITSLFTSLLNGFIIYFVFYSIYLIFNIKRYKTY